jgi:hypothetical protein
VVELRSDTTRLNPNTPNLPDQLAVSIPPLPQLQRPCTGHSTPIRRTLLDQLYPPSDQEKISPPPKSLNPTRKRVDPESSLKTFSPADHPSIQEPIRIWIIVMVKEGGPALDSL